MNSEFSNGLPGFGVSFDGRSPVPVVLEQASAAEAAGAVSFWVACHLFFREPFSMAAAILSVTARPRVALMAVSPYIVHPVQIAMAAATLDELAPGRVVLCLGRGVSVDLADAGVEPRGVVQTLREACEIIRMLLAGDRVKYQGDVFCINGRHLDGGQHQIPLFLAASGVQTLELAGAIADGVLLSTASSVEFVQWALEQVDRGAKGRTVKRVGLVYAAAASREADALNRFRRLLAVTLGGRHHARNVKLAGSSLDQDAVRGAVANEDWANAEALVSDDIVRKHTASGTADQMRERLAAYRLAGLDEVVLASMRDPDEMSRTLRWATGSS